MMDCKQITDHDLLEFYFRQEDEARLTRVLNCFDKQFYNDVLSTFYKRVFNRWPSTKHKEELFAKEAYNEGLLHFYLYIRKHGFKTKRATVGTLFTTFCLRRLLGLVTRYVRAPDNKFTVDILDFGDQGEATEPDNVTRELEQIKEENLEMLMLAFDKLDTRCANLLIWRKVEKLSNEEIAARMEDLSPQSVNNEVYRCSVRLMKLLDRLKKGK